MAVIITNMDMPETCWKCLLYDGENGICKYLGFKYIGVADPSVERESDCPLKSLDDAIDDIQTNINSMKENAKLHEKGIRQNGEMIAAGLQMALDIIDSYCKENK